MDLRMNRKCICAERPPFPENMLIELTNACNQACIFCANAKQKRKISKCDKELFMRLIEEAYENGVREIGFYMTGEPLLCPDLEEYIQKSSDIYGNGNSGFDYIYLTTNGVLADIERIKKLVSYGLSSIKFSVNAATGDVYRKLHGKDDFDVVKANIKALHQARENGDLNIPVFISFIRTKYNYFQEELMKQVFGSYVDKIYFFDVNNHGGIMYENNHLRPPEVEVASQRTLCELLFNRIHINSDGYLTACCVDFDNMLAIVDLSQVSLRDAWCDERLVQLRKQHICGRLKNNQCFNCIHNTLNTDIEPVNRELYQKHS